MSSYSHIPSYYAEWMGKYLTCSIVQIITNVYFPNTVEKTEIFSHMKIFYQRQTPSLQFLFYAKIFFIVVKAI